MNYNQFSHPSIDQTWTELDHPLCKRAKLDTGKLCNLNCKFCYYKYQLDQMDDLDTIKKRVDYLTTYSLITEIELSGGESSIHPQWFEILDYCSQYYNHISTLSHGQKFANNEFLLKSKEHGLKEILFSVHGYGYEHDEIVQKMGAYHKLNQAINNSLDNELITRINCTVTPENIKNLTTGFLNDILYFIERGLKQLNFIFYNYWDDNKKGQLFNYPDLTKPIEIIIEVIKRVYPDFDIRLRYIPFCMISEEYHSLIYGQYQHVFDTTDWNKEVYSGKQYFNKNYKYSWKESLSLGWQAAKQSRLHTYFKPKECYKCKHFIWCDGIEKQLKDTQKVYPRERNPNGIRIKNNI